MNIAMVELLAQTPFYDRYLSESLVSLVDHLTLYTIRFHHEPDYFKGVSFRRSPGLTDRLSIALSDFGPLRQIGKLLEYKLNWRHLVRAFRSCPPDVVHIQRLPLWTRPFWLSEKRDVEKLLDINVPVVYTAHNYLPHDAPLSVKSAYQILYRSLDHVIVHTQIDRQRLITQFGVDEHQITVIPHGPLFSEQIGFPGGIARNTLGLEADNFVFLMLGVIRPYKGVEEIIQALAAVVPQYPECRLLIAGNVLDSEYLRRLETLIDELEMQRYVRWHLGYVPSAQIGLFHAAADVILFPYRDISQSGAFLTAAGLGKCTLSTAVGGLKEIVRAGENGIQVAAADPSLLAAGLRRCIALSPEERVRMGEALRLDVEARYNWSSIARRTLEVYRSVLAEGV